MKHKNTHKSEDGRYLYYPDGRLFDTLAKRWVFSGGIDILSRSSRESILRGHWCGFKWIKERPVQLENK